MRFLPVFLDLKAGAHRFSWARGELALAKLRLLLRPERVCAGMRRRRPRSGGRSADDAAQVEIAAGDPLTADLTGVIAVLCAGAGDVGVAWRRGRVRSVFPSM